MRQDSPKIMVTADDFGFTAGVTDGILKSHDDGIITHTGLMVNMSDCKRAALLAKTRENLSVGLHLNLTQGTPLCKPSDVKSLVDSNGQFRKLGLSHPRAAKTSDLEREIRAQIEKFCQFGFPQLHIDGHHYVTFMPKVLGIIAKIAPEYNIKSVRMIDSNMIKLGVKKVILAFSVLILGFKSVLGIKRFINWGRSVLEDAGLSMPDCLVSWQLFGNDDPENAIIRTISSLSTGITELFGHPGFVDSELENISSFTDLRLRELQAFTSPNVKQALLESNAQLINAYALGGY